MTVDTQPSFKIVEIDTLPATSCACGAAKRAFTDVPGAPLSLHEVEISVDAKTHYHKRQTEVYYILECQPDARIELNGEYYPVRPGMSIMIPPLTRHRAVGRMKILNIVSPPVDPADEWFDEPA